MAILIRQNGKSENIDMSMYLKPGDQEAKITEALISEHPKGLAGRTLDFGLWKTPAESLAFKEGYGYIAALIGKDLGLSACPRAQNFSGGCIVKPDVPKKLAGPLMFFKVDEIHSELYSRKKRGT